LTNTSKHLTIQVSYLPKYFGGKQKEVSQMPVKKTKKVVKKTATKKTKTKAKKRK